MEESHLYQFDGARVVALVLCEQRPLGGAAGHLSEKRETAYLSVAERLRVAPSEPDPADWLACCTEQGEGGGRLETPKLAVAGGAGEVPVGLGARPRPEDRTPPDEGGAERGALVER